MALYPYVATLAVDPVTLVKAAGATGVIYAPGDTSFASPLTATDATGNPIPLTANADGILPSFYATAPAVNWRSGSYVFPLVTSQPLEGPKGDPGTPGNDGSNGKDGKDGLPGPNSVPTADAVKTYIETPGNPVNAALRSTYAGAMRSIQQYRSLVDSFGSNWAPAIQAAHDAAERGETIDMRQNDGLNGYRITSGITVTKPNIRFLGRPRDGYAMSIRCNTAGVTMFSVKATGVVFEDLALIGDVSAINGVGATVNGIELFGGVDGDLDALVKGCTFQWLATPVRLRGRNATVRDCLFSNSLGGVVIDGKDATYHTGPNADQNRGNLIFKNRFHNIGANANNSAFEITSNTKVLHAVIEGNHFDSTGGGRHIKVTGTAANMHGGLKFFSNTHTEAQADAYHLTYVQNSKIVDADISAFTATTFYGSGIVLANCDSVSIVNPSILQMGNSGIVATSSARIRVYGGVIRAIGGNPATVAHGLDFNASNTQCRFIDVVVEGADGYGFNGNPSDSYMTGEEFRSCALGKINSSTLRTGDVELGAKYVAKKERSRTLGTTKTLVTTGTHLGFPFAVTAGDGNLIVAWRDGANHAPSKGVMKVARYSQSGAVLQSPTTVRDDPTYDTRDAGLLLLADGRLALTFFVYSHAAETAVLDGCRVMFSSDHGATWGAPITIDSAFTTWAASAGPMIQLPNGNLLMPTYGVSAGQTFQHAHVSRSTDGGATWAPLAVMANGDTQGGRHYQEPNIILTDAGDILAVIRSDTALAHYTSRSSDGGVTWSAPVFAFAGNGAPRLTKQAGYIQCLHRHESTGRAVKVSSGDSGVTWGNQLTLPVSGGKVSSAYGVAVPYGKDSLRYIYSLQEGANNVATANILMVDSIVPEDRAAPGPVTCRLRMTASAQVNSATWTSLPFATEDHDTDDMHSTATNNSRITIRTAGYYFVKGTVYIAASATPGQVQARAIKNGVAGVPGLRDKKSPAADQDALVTISDVVYLNAGDYLQLQAYQDSGAALSARTEDTTFSVALVGGLV